MTDKQRLSSKLWEETKSLFVLDMIMSTLLFWFDLGEQGGRDIRADIGLSFALYAVFMYTAILVHHIYRHWRYRDVRW